MRLSGCSMINAVGRLFLCRLQLGGLRRELARDAPQTTRQCVIINRSEFGEKKQNLVPFTMFPVVKIPILAVEYRISVQWPNAK